MSGASEHPLRPALEMLALGIVDIGVGVARLAGAAENLADVLHDLTTRLDKETSSGD